MTRYSFTRVSHNRKTGPIPITMTSADTCPDSCALKGNGCYAETGPVNWQWSRLALPLDAPRARGGSLDQLCNLIRTIPGGSLWRHNVAGDLPGTGESIDVAALHAIVRAQRGRHGFTYTHKAPIGENLVAMSEAVAAGFIINLSADNAAIADNLADTGLPVVVVIPTDAPKVTRTPRGRKIVQCPAENSDRVTCANCGLCAVADRTYIIGFKPKGVKKRHVNKIAQGN